jgi:UDP-3-O-[3-hydroxymyristoyl] glucosamine N-acyltransferase
MQFTATQIAQLIQGTVVGNAHASVSSFGKIEEATEQQLSFLANPKYEEHLYTSKASVVIINQSLQLKQPVTPTLITVPDAYAAFAKLLQFYQSLQQPTAQGVEEHAVVHPSVQLPAKHYVGAFTYISEKVILGDGCVIYPNVFIGKNVQLGNHVTLHPGVVIYHGCVVGNHVTIHAGAVIGADGFGFAPQADGSYEKVPQIGNVIIEDHVEIGANTCIDRATIGSTVVKKGVKLDNLIQVAHNAEVGSHTVIAAQAGISGSTKLGTGCVIGGQAGIVGHIQLAPGSKINAQSGVTKTIKTPNTSLTGTPASDFTTNLRLQAQVRNLPKLEARIKQLEEAISQLLNNRQ